MKNYEQPAIELIKFSVMDVLSDSGFDTGEQTNTNGEPEVGSGEGFGF